jgi:drug/metabolite transporter (DMT)-like permease
MNPYLRLHFIVFLWGFTSILGKEISLSAEKVVIYRTALSALAISLIVLLSPKQSLKVSLRQSARMIGVGFLVGAHWFSFFYSAKISTVSICLAGISTVSLFTAFVEPWLKRKRVKGYEIVLGLSIVLGLYVIFSFEFNHFWGLFFALLAAFFGALFSGFNALLIHKSDPFTITFYEMLGAFLFSVLVAFIEPNDLWMPTAIDWLYIFPLALLCTVFAFFESLRLLKFFSVFTMNLVVNLEPVYGIVLALIIYGRAEQMTSGFYLGALVIFATIFIHPVLKQRFG